MKKYPQQLRRIRHLLQGARLIGAVLGSLAIAALMWIGFGLVDALFAFESHPRVIITGVLLTVCGLVALIAVIRALRVSAVNAAAAADTALKDSRALVSAGLTLEQSTTGTPLSLVLAERALDQAATALAGMRASRILPWRLLRIATVVLVVPLVIWASLRALRPDAYAVVVARLLNPGSDIAPYSPLSFQLEPTKLQVVYGGDLQVTTEITGGALEYPVECWMRRPGSHEVLHLPAFRESPTRFTRKLDSLTEPFEVAYACGKARSKWQPVEILMEPNILSGRVRVEPPAYTGLPAAEFTLDTNEISALEGAMVTLELTSNRPLASGELVFSPASIAGVGAEKQTRLGKVVDSQRVSFTWMATASGRLTAGLRDERGTPSPRPLDLAFRCVPDMAPSVTLTSPPRALLATPKTKIPVQGRAEDDYALSKLRFVRTLSGFRDRSLIVASELTQKRQDFETVLDLSDLGLEAGQTIELMIDAADHNPSMMGLGGSEISKVRIISEDQYAEYIRAKTTIAQFIARFNAARDAMGKAREALERLKKAVEDDAGVDAAVDAAAAEQLKAAEMLEQLTNDFTAFELEKRLQDLAQQQAEDLRANLGALKQFDLKKPKAEQQQAIDDMLRGLQREAPQAKKLEQDVATLKMAAGILEMAARFRRIYDAQASLAKRLGGIVEQLRMGDGQGRRMLPALGENQEKNRQALDDFKNELTRRLEALPPGREEFTELADSARQFLNELKTAEPETMMDAAAKHGKEGQAMDAFTQAERARAVLERLLTMPNNFAQAANGKTPDLDLPQLDVQKTLGQLLEGLLAQEKNEQGQNPGQGQEPGGEGGQNGAGDGLSMNLPVIGPDRMQFSNEPLAGSGQSQGDKGTTKPLPKNAEHGTMKSESPRLGQSTTTTPEAVPESYRDAVKQYLTP